MSKKSKEAASESLLDNLVLAAPCSVPWAAMEGDNRKRCCGGCSRFVYNISDMSKTEAEDFLQAHGTNECMIFYRRFDGTILTDNCPVGLRAIRDKAKLVWKVVASFASLIFSISFARAQTVDNQPVSRPAAPPGFEYTGNPAGGGVILRPVQQTRPNVALPGKVVAIPHSNFPGTQNPPIPPATMPGTPAPRPTVHLHAQQNVLLNKAALELYNKGKAAAEQGHNTLAEFYFEKALDQFDLQKNGDIKFRAEIERALTQSRKK